MGVGIETSAQQKGFISVIQDKMIRENNFFTILSNGAEPGLKPAGDKFQRFNVVQPMFATRKIWLPRELKLDPFVIEMLSELKGVGKTNPNPRKLGKARHDDILDTISQLGMFDIITPTIGKTVKSIEVDPAIYYSDVEEDDMEKDPYSMV